MGGGAASSMLQGDNKSDLDFNAVQRGDAEMAQVWWPLLVWNRKNWVIQ